MNFWRDLYTNFRERRADSKAIILLLLVILSTPLYAQEDSVKINYPAIDYGIPKDYIIKDVKVTGVKFLSADLIRNTTGLNVGDKVTIPGDNISQAMQVLWQHRYYSDIKTYVDIEGDSVTINIALTERPRVSMWKIDSVKTGESKELFTKLKLRERVEYSDYSINNAVNSIKRHFFDKGFMFTEVDVVQKPDTMLNNYVVVHFVVDKGEKVKIGKINFAGNTELDEKVLKKALKKTKEKKLKNMFKGAKYTTERFEEDKENLMDFLHSKGYRDGMILSDSLYRISEDRIGLDIAIQEGHKYYYRDIEFVGNSKYDSKTLSTILGIQKGDTYDRKTMESRIGTDGQSVMEGATTVSSIYQNDGHLAFRIEPVETVIDGDSIDIELRMSEGKQFTVNRVTISGNDRTNDRVVRRELYVRPGELYSQELLVSSLRKIGTMGHFNPENVAPDILPVSDELVDIGFALEEQPSDQFEVSGGWGAGMFVASVGVTFNNVSVRKALDKDAWRPYPTGDNQKLNIQVQSNGTYYKSAAVSFSEPWFGGKKPNAFSLSFYLSEQTDAYYAWQESTQSFMTIGATLGYGKRLSWPDPNFQIMGEVNYQAYNLKNWGGFLIENGYANILTLAGTVSRNSLDQMIYPRRGSEMTLRFELTPPYSAFNDKDYSDPDMSDNERYKWIEYYKWTGSFRWFTAMLPNKKLVLMSKAEFGYLGHYSNSNISPFEGYRVGGDGMSGYTLYGVDNIGLRGYSDAALTPNADYGDQARMYTKYAMELRYPVILSPQSTVYGVAFAEAGNAWEGFTQFNPFSLKRSAGAGVRLYLPIVGMFGIDWAYGFDDTPGDPGVRSGSQFHFSIGQMF